jgi:transcriptional regulator of aromatic amino acid metabolism
VGRAQQLAKSRVPVLLLGETGVGKDVFARCIHESGATRDAPFVALNCGGFSRELLTSELFGYTEGSFTGARRGGMIGKIEAADGGTLFLDEIGEMPIDLQPHFAGAGGGRGVSPGREQAAQGQFPPHRRHQPGSAQGDPGRALPHGPCSTGWR